MTKKKKNTQNNYKPRQYCVSVHKYGPSMNISVTQDVKEEKQHSQTLSVQINNLTTDNKNRDVELFNVLHYAISRATGARYPGEVSEVLDYADNFFSHLDIDMAYGVTCGDNITLELVDMDFKAEFPADKKSREHAHDSSARYSYQIFGEKGERRAVSDLEKAIQTHDNQSENKKITQKNQD